MSKFFTYEERLELQKYLKKAFPLKKSAADWIKIQPLSLERYASIILKLLLVIRDIPLMPVKVASNVEVRIYVVHTVRVKQLPIVSFVPPAMRTVPILYWKPVLQDLGFLMSVMVVKH